MDSFWIEAEADMTTPTTRSECQRQRGAARLRMLVLLAGTALALAGCYRTPKTELAESIPTDYRERHPIALQEKERRMDVVIGVSRGNLTATQRAEVMAYATTWRREATGGIFIDVPVGTTNARSAHDALREITALLHAGGVPPRSYAVRNYTPADRAELATVRLNYPRVVAAAGPCGLWPEDLGPSMSPIYQSNRPYWNHGCATQRNLAAMVANPEDLVQPRSEAPVYAGRRGVVLEKYRKGESTATIDPDANKGKISDVGQ